jgi:hypothetical protein
LSLEEIDLCFGDRALGTLPADLEAKKGDQHLELREGEEEAERR